MDDIKNKKDLINEFGGLKLYITELNKAMDKTAEDKQPLSQSDKTAEDEQPLSQSDKTTEDEPPLSQSDKTTILTNMYCDNLHFSKKDAKDLIEHPEKMQQYCIKYGYKY